MNRGLFELYLSHFNKDWKNQLKICEHSDNDLNSYHYEGDVYTHTMMVVKEALVICKDDGVTETEFKIVLLACLLHDLGKPFAKHERDGRTFMSGHEIISASMGLSWLKQKQELFMLTDLDIERVIDLVLHHTVAHKAEYDYEDPLLDIVNCADERGRIMKGMF